MEDYTKEKISTAVGTLMFQTDNMNLHDIAITIATSIFEIIDNAEYCGDDDEANKDDMMEQYLELICGMAKCLYNNKEIIDEDQSLWGRH